MKDKKTEEAKKKAKKVMDRILEVDRFMDFVEIVGKMGGDTVTFRYYDDGRVYER